MNYAKSEKRPLIIALFALILWGQALLLPIFFVIGLLAPDSKLLWVNGTGLSMRDAPLEVAGITIVWFIFAAYVGPGLWKGKPRARTGLFLLHCIACLTPLAFPQKYVELPLILVMLGIFGAYLYFVPGMNAYFSTSEQPNN